MLISFHDVTTNERNPYCVAPTGGGVAVVDWGTVFPNNLTGFISKLLKKRTLI